MLPKVYLNVNNCEKKLDQNFFLILHFPKFKKLILTVSHFSGVKFPRPVLDPASGSAVYKRLVVGG